MSQVRTRQRDRAHSDAEENGSPRKKRRARVTRACDECRRRKDRCDGREPICRPCDEGDRQCTYNPMKKRGLPPGYVRAVEVVLGLVFRSINGSDSSISALLRGEVGLANPDGSQATISQGVSPVETLLDTWRKSTVLKELEKILLAESASDEEVSGQTLEERLTHAFSAVSTTAFQLHDVNEPTPALSLPSNPPQSRPSCPPDPSSKRSTRHSVALPEQDPSHEGHVLPPHWSQLLDLYFSNTHCWFPIAQKHEILRSGYLIAEKTTAKQEGPMARGERAFLWAVFAYTSRQCKVSGITFNNAEIMSQNKRYAKQLQGEAESLLAQDHLEGSIGHVRALLIMTLLQVGLGSWTKAWQYIGQAVYLAVDLGLFPGPQDETRLASDSGQNRTALGCFIMETMIAAHLGRRPYLTQSDLKLVVLQADGIEEWEPWQPNSSSRNLSAFNNQPHQHIPGHVLSVFQHLARIIGILNDLISQRAAAISGDFLSQLSQNLSSWAEQLPLHLRGPFGSEVSSSKPQSPQALNLCLAFIGVLIAIKTRALSPPDAVPGSADMLSGIRKPLDFATLQLQGFLLNLIPPVSKVYVSSLDRWRSVSNPLFYGNDGPGCGKVCDILRAELERTWEAVELVEDTTDCSLPLPPSNYPQTVDDTIFQSIDHDALPVEDDNESLFNSLALLDPVDWSANPPEFMERLGITRGAVPEDFESLFIIQ